MNLAFFASAKVMASSVAVSQACSAVTMSIGIVKRRRRYGVGNAEIEKMRSLNPACAASARELSTSAARVSMPYMWCGCGNDLSTRSCRMNPR